MNFNGQPLKLKLKFNRPITRHRYGTYVFVHAGFIKRLNGGPAASLSSHTNSKGGRRATGAVHRCLYRRHHLAASAQYTAKTKATWFDGFPTKKLSRNMIFVCGNSEQAIRGTSTQNGRAAACVLTVAPPQKCTAQTTALADARTSSKKQRNGRPAF